MESAMLGAEVKGTVKLDIFLKMIIGYWRNTVRRIMIVRVAKR